MAEPNVDDLIQQLKDYQVSPAFIDQYLTDPKTGQPYQNDEKLKLLTLLANKIQAISGSVDAQQKAVNLYASQSTLAALKKAKDDGTAPVAALQAYFDTLNKQAQSILSATQADAASQNIGKLLAKHGLDAQGTEDALNGKGKSYFERMQELMNDDQATQLGLKSVLDVVIANAQASSAPAKAQAEIAEAIAKSQKFTDLAAKGDKRSGAEELYYQQLLTAKGQAAAQAVNGEDWAAMVARVQAGKGTGAETSFVAQTQNTIATAQATQLQVGWSKWAANYLGLKVGPDGSIEGNGNLTGTGGSIAHEAFEKTWKSLPGLGN